MPKGQLESESIHRCQILLYASDLEFLQSRFGDNVGVSAAVRLIVRKFRNKLEEKLSNLDDIESFSHEERLNND
jgi:hypothetical protein